MPRTNGDFTKTRILQVAEKLFSETGFDATSVDAIAKDAGVNKATLYYHFKDKQDIVISIFNAMLTHLSDILKWENVEGEEKTEMVKKKLDFVRKNRKTFSIMLMEALKDKAFNEIFFHSTRMMIEQNDENNSTNLETKSEQKKYVSEFFNTLMPIILFAILEDKWCNFYGFENESVEND